MPDDIYGGIGYGTSGEHFYKGVLWDASESPLLKGYDYDMENMAEEKKDNSMTVVDALELKYILEAQIQELLNEYQKRTGLPVITVDFETCDECDGIENVMVGVLLEQI